MRAIFAPAHGGAAAKTRKPIAHPEAGCRRALGWGALSLYLLLLRYRQCREPDVRARFSFGPATGNQHGAARRILAPSPEQLPDYRSHR
jgi:hypothetical protein